MNRREAVINPGSNRRWLLSLTPLFYYDRIYIEPGFKHEIESQGDKSSFHEQAALMLGLILKNPDEEILCIDSKLPWKGRSKQIEKESKDISEQIILEASYSVSNEPSLVSAVELKNAMKSAYKEWLDYNQRKADILNRDEILYRVLTKELLPHSTSNYKKIMETPARNIPELFRNNDELKTTLKELVRNGMLLLNLGKNSMIRVYDGLIEEFIPFIELVERINNYREIPAEVRKNISFSLLSNLYKFSWNKEKAKPPGRLTVVQAFERALKERNNLKVLRQRMAELDNFINERSLRPDEAFKEIKSIIGRINKTVRRIEAIGTWSLWGTTAYLFSELVSSLSAPIKYLLKAAVTNPANIIAAKEFIKNYYVALSGIAPKSSSYITLIRDYYSIKTSAEMKREYKTSPNIFEFWGG